MENDNFCEGNCAGCERFEEEQKKTAGEEGAKEETWVRSKESEQEEELDKLVKEMAKKEKGGKNTKRKNRESKSPLS